MNITLDIKCPELAEAINNLAAAMSIRSVDGALQDIVKPAEKPKAGKPSTGTGSGRVIPLTTEPVVGIDAEPVAPKEDLHDPRHVGAAARTDQKTRFADVDALIRDLSDGDGPEPAAEPEAPAVDYNQVKTAVMAVSKAKGREAAVALLGEFDAKVGGDLAEDQWGPFLARAAEVLG